MPSYNSKTINKRQKARDKTLEIVKPYLRLPYSIIRSAEFKLLSAEARSIYFILIRYWSTEEPHKPIPLSYRNITKELKISNTSVVLAINQLEQNGFIASVKENRRVTRYLIECKWFDGQYK